MRVAHLFYSAAALVARLGGKSDEPIADMFVNGVLSTGWGMSAQRDGQLACASYTLRGAPFMFSGVLQWFLLRTQEQIGRADHRDDHYPA